MAAFQEAARPVWDEIRPLLDGEIVDYCYRRCVRRFQTKPKADRRVSLRPAGPASGKGEIHEA